MKEIYKMQCVEIKKTIEKLSGIKNIGQNNRKGIIPDLKKAYFRLCRDKTDASFYIIAKALSETFTHGSVIYGIKAFDLLKKTKQLKCITIYEVANHQIKNYKNLSYNSELLSKFLTFYEEEKNKNVVERTKDYYVKLFIEKNNLA